MNWWIKICVSLAISSLFAEGSISKALHELRDDPYGFVLCDEGVSQEDLEHYKSLDIQREWVFHQFGEFDILKESLACFLSEMSSNEKELTLQVASHISAIVQEVLAASGKETGWICLCSFIPIDRYDIPRWHVDGPYYPPNGPQDLLFKFVITLVGPSTLFYPLPLELRKITANMALNRQFMKNLCKPENSVSPHLGQGAVFKSGPYTAITGLHSEPPIHENRLFLSIVPCTERQLPHLKARVAAVYPPKSTF